MIRRNAILRIAILRLAILAAIAFTGAGAALAHHNPMEGFDAKSPVVLTGEITGIDWSGEHAQIFIASKDGKSWKVQAARVETMRENGLDEAALGARETVRIRGYPSLDRSCKPDCIATGRDITFADGLRVLLDGSHAGDKARAVHDQRVAARAKLRR